MKWHKSYQKQGIECRKSGNSFVVEVPEARGFYVSVPACAVIVCVQFKTYCHSKACREMRIGLHSQNCSVATDFEYRQFGDELAKCQRYYEKSYDYDVDPSTSKA